MSIGPVLTEYFIIVDDLKCVSKYTLSSNPEWLQGWAISGDVMNT